jgi:glycosyltransferase involved in cell wall biosynthesis
VKHIEDLIDVLAEVRKKHPVTLTIVGSAIDEKGKSYEDSLRKKTQEMNLTDAVIFHGPATPKDMPDLLNKAKIFVTASQTGSLDKVILEAMACGLPVVSMAEGMSSLKIEEHQVSSIDAFETELVKMIESGCYKLQEYVLCIEKEHSLGKLIDNMCKHYVE